MNVQIIPNEYSEVPINEHGELCEKDDIALGIVVHSRTGSPYDAGHVDAWGDVRIIASSSQNWRIGADITPVRICSKLVRSEGEYPNEVGMKIIPTPTSRNENKLEVRKLIVEDKAILGIFILSPSFVLWGDDGRKYAELLPSLWKDSEVVFEIDL